MKKLTFVLFIFCSCFSIFATEEVKPKTVITDPAIQICENPAYVYFYDSKYTSKVSGFLEDEIPLGNPSLKIDSVIVGNNLAAELAASFLLENPILSEESVFYDSVEKFDLDVSASAGFSKFAGGVGVKISSRLTRKGIEVRNEYKFSDIVRQVVQEHDRDKNASEAKLRLGLMFNINSFWVGILCDDIFSYKNGSSQFSLPNLLDSMTVGFSYCGPLYGQHGKINLVSFSTAAEVGHMFSLERITLLLGGRLVLQYVREGTFFVEGWYRTRFSSFGTGNATIKAGAGFDNLFIDFALNTSFSPEKEANTVSVEFSALF